MGLRMGLMVRKFSFLLAIMAALAILPMGSMISQSWAAATDEADTPAADPRYAKGVTAVKAKRFDQAIPLMEAVVDADPKNADAWNWLGYSHRKSGDFDAALRSYNQALALKPKHRGANEYLGELYLQMGKLDQAEQRLVVLDSACFFGCEEYRELKEAIAYFKEHGKAPDDHD
jgi:tetratricopeptide (TPR) repeat protein